METDPASERLVGSAKTVEGACPSGEVQIGRVIDANQGVVELFGESIRLPEGAYHPEALAEGE